ncbi:MAG: sodium/proline symporter [Alphaproteobacteria bacterium]|nr:MAG: sodium/proline symporter [Alphaproteobacteria bacterium]
MDQQDLIIATLVAYKVLLLGIGFWAARRVHNEGDFFIGGRGLGGFIAGMSYAASTSSAWVILGFSGFVYSVGVAALWMIPGILGGYAVSWLWFGPRLRAEAESKGYVTLTDFLVGDGSGPYARLLAIGAAILTAVCFTFYVAAQFDAAATAFVSQFGMGFTNSVLLGAAIILVYCLLGGFWAVSVTDALQGMLMLAIAVILPGCALVLALDGSVTRELSFPTLSDWGGGHSGWVLLGFIIGTMGVGLGALGQPHLLNRLMAVKDDAARRRAFAYSMGWGILVYAGMAILALSARALSVQVTDGEALFYHMTSTIMPPVFAGLVIAAILSAIMSTVDSILLASAGAVAHDTGLAKRFAGSELLISRLTMSAIALLAVLLTLAAPASIFERVLFSWAALGAAFGPIVAIRVVGLEPSTRARFWAMLAGFGGALLFSLAETLGEAGGIVAGLARAPGDPFERVAPWILPLFILSISALRTRKARHV